MVNFVIQLNRDTDSIRFSTKQIVLSSSVLLLSMDHHSFMDLNGVSVWSACFSKREAGKS